MNIFLVEDEPSVRRIFEEACSQEQVGITVCDNQQAAVDAIESDDANFDLAICDLKIPSVPGAIDEDLRHGSAVLYRILEAWPGIPVVVLSAFGTVEVVSRMLLDAHQIDIYGAGQDQPMLRFVQKAQLAEAVRIIRDIKSELAELEQIELYNPSLSDEYRRAVRVFARRKKGAVVDYRALAGGRSGAQTALITVQDNSGAQTAYAVAKLTTYARAIEEKGRYQSHISGRLGAATFTDLIDEVMAGAGGYAGLFYSVADAFQHDAFTVLRDNPEGAASIVESLAEMISPWLAGVSRTTMSWSAVRRNLISDEGYDRVRSQYQIVEIPEDRSISAVWCTQHGDLHGANVLVNSALRPVLIDYGRTGLGPSVLDPITLELSATFHPDSPMRDERWPTVADLANWSHLDNYLTDCPYPDFVRACRGWSTKVKVGQRDLFATVTAYLLRNLQYEDVDKERALTLQHFAASQVNAS